MNFQQIKKKLIEYWRESKTISDERLFSAFMEIPREAFILKENIEYAYNDYPLPIFGGQTISQPTTIMIMLEALELKEDDKVLEIGTGSGYNAALISRICKKGMVYSTEIVPELVEFARKNLKKIGIKNVKVIEWDGSMGYEKEAPYDKIISTAAAPEIPKPWLDQLKINGIIVSPVGPSYAQEMMKIRKTRKGIQIKELGSFIFVPLKGKYGYS